MKRSIIRVNQGSRQKGSFLRQNILRNGLESRLEEH
jgi:hypothetical protein